MTNPKYRLSSLLFAALVFALLVGAYALRRDLTRKAWTDADGVWKLAELDVDGELMEIPETYLQIDSARVTCIFGDQRSTGFVRPHFGGIDFAYADGTRSLALFDTKNGRLRMCQTKDGTTRPSKIPDKRAEIADYVLMEFVRHDAFDFEEFAEFAVQSPPDFND